MNKNKILKIIMIIISIMAIFFITFFFITKSKKIKIGNNTSSQENIENILNAYKKRGDIEYISKLVPNSVVAENDYNLSVSTYVEQEDTREKIDIKELNAEISKIVEREHVLRDAIDRIIAEIEVDE